MKPVNTNKASKRGEDRGGWHEFTPTYTGFYVGRRTLWQWLLRKPRPQVKADTPPMYYKQVGKTVHIKSTYKPNQPKAKETQL